MRRLLNATFHQLCVWIAIAKEDVEAAHAAANVLNVDFWACDEPETLVETDIDDAIASYVDECDGPCDLIATGYRRTVVPEHVWPDQQDRILELLYENLDEQYNSGDDPSEPTARVIEAAKAFMDIVRREYEPWNCEDVVAVTVARDEAAALLRERYDDDETPQTDRHRGQRTPGAVAE